MSGPFGSSQWMYSSGGFDIGQSLKFNDDESQYLSWTPASAGNRKTWTFSAWVKRGNLGADNYLLSVPDSTGHASFRFNSSTDTLEWSAFTAGYGVATTSATFRDVSAWYHIVLSYDTTNATSTDRIKIYVNGTLQSTSSYTAPTLNIDTPVSNTVTQYIGKSASASQYLDGYLADVYFIDGTALDPTSFGESIDGYWRPIAYSGSYGSNGFHLEFDGAVTDSSGNGNDWTANNISAHDYMPDVPGNNFAVLNAVDGNATSYSEGNLRFVGDTSYVYYGGGIGTFGISSGKWYWEAYAYDSDWLCVGTIPEAAGAISSSTNLNYLLNARTYMKNGNKTVGTGSGQTSTAYGATFTDGDIIGVALDMDAGSLTFYKNGTSQGTAFISITGTQMPLGTGFNSGSAIFNFGQDSTFAGNKPMGSYTDANGIGNFQYAPPTGYLSLCTSNLPTPTIVDGSQHFNTVLWTGNGSTQSITGAGHQPDLVWSKDRGAAYDHTLFDSVRGATKFLRSNGTTAEETRTDSLTSFDSDGFSVGADAVRNNINRSGASYVSWNWKAGGTAVSNTDGSITSQVSANTDMGFSIVSYTGTGSAATVGHSLGVAPSMVIVKNRSAADGWLVWHEGLSSGTSYLLLHSTNAQASNSAYFNGSPTSSVFNIGTSTNTNGSGNDLIAYCFANSDIIKCGSYTGNGSSTDGTFVSTGFRPSFFLLKRTDAAGEDWLIYDNSRDPFNRSGNETVLRPNTSAAEQSYGSIDFLSNGVKFYTSGGALNASGGTYIYLAIASTPFKFSPAR